MFKGNLILITGATGAVGPRIVKAFLDAGYSIRTLSIDPPLAWIWPDNIETRIGDITDSSTLQAAMEGIESVIHMAALLHVVNPVPGLREKYEHVNVGGTATVVDAAIKAGVERVVLFSTIAVYGSESGRVFNEDSPTHPDTLYAQTKLAAEEIMLNARRADGEPIGTVLRLGAVYGSRIKGNYERMVRSLACNRFIPVGDGLNRRTLVYDKDVATAAVLAVEDPVAAGRIYNVTDGNYYGLNQIVLAICEALGRKPPHFSLPVAPARFAAGVLEDGARLCRCRSPITRATIDKYTEDIAVESTLIQKELGFVPQYDLKTGWRETILEMRERGIL
jgi:UDP-glucose 4-epimerase